MAITLPLPVRVAAGVLATGLDRLRRLPQDLPALSVTVAGQAMKASLRVQQEIAELAGRGDELLAGVTSRPTERPEWARFDDEESVTVEGTVDEAGREANTDQAGGHTGGSRAAATAGSDPAATADNAAGSADPPDPPDLPEYDQLRLPALRTRLRDLDADAVARLVQHERETKARASYLTVLGNRLSTLRGEAGEDPHA